MVVTDAQMDSLKEDIRAIGDTVSELVTRVAAHDSRFDQVDRRLDRIDGRLDVHDSRFDQVDGRLGRIEGTLHEILTIVRRDLSRRLAPLPGSRSWVNAQDAASAGRRPVPAAGATRSRRSRFPFPRGGRSRCPGRERGPLYSITAA